MRRLFGRLAYIVIWPYVKLGLNSKRAYVLLIDKGLQEVFLVKNLLSWRNEWFLPGGGLKKNENYLQAVCREVKEELGLKLDSKKLKEFCVLPGKNKLRPGQRVVFVYPLKKCVLNYNRRELISVTWKSLEAEIDIDESFRPALDKAAAYKEQASARYGIKDASLASTE